MRKTVVLIISLALAAACAREQEPVFVPDNRETEESEESEETEAAQASTPGRLRIKFHEGADPGSIIITKDGISSDDPALDSVARALGVKGLRRVFPYAGKFEERTRREGLHLWYDVWFDEKRPVTKAGDGFLSLPGVEYAEPVYKTKNTSNTIPFPMISAFSAPRGETDGKAFTNDPEFSRQWHYFNDGSLKYSTAGSDINLPRAWEITSGRPEVVVAVVDGGIDIEHEDLKGSIGNMAEINGLEGVDDDGNGYVDDLYGWNFIFTEADSASRYAPGCNIITKESHGTHVAGTIAAENNNGIGVCGIAGGSGNHSGIRLLSCQIFTSSPFDDGDGISAIKYGADAGAVISQNSWGYDTKWVKKLPQATKDAIDYFIKYAGMDENGEQVGPVAGGVVIFAAGNEDTDSPAIPASYEEVVSVASVAPDFKRAYYSNYGDWVTIAAPGGSAPYDGRYTNLCEVYSTLPDNRYGYYQGTSMACPHASGVAALIASEFGGPGFTNEKLKAYLVRSAKNIDKYNPGFEGKLGSGLVDAYRALSADRGIAPEPVKDLAAGKTAGQVELTWTVPADEDDGRADSFILIWKKGTISNPDPDKIPEEAVSDIVNASKMQLGEKAAYLLEDMWENTTYSVAIWAVDPWGNKSAVSTLTFTTPKNEPPVISAPDHEGIKLGYSKRDTVYVDVTDPDSMDFTFEVSEDSGQVETFRKGRRIYFIINNYKCTPGDFTIHLTVTDNFGAKDEKDIRFTLAPNLPPVVVKELVPVYFGAMGESINIRPEDYFTDEIPETVRYGIEYEYGELNVMKERDGSFTISPSRFITTGIALSATDEEGLKTVTESVRILTRDDSREIDIYPNPVRDIVHIRMGRDVSGTISIRAVNAAGRVVFKGESPIAPTEPAEADLSALTPGTYTLRITCGGKEIERNIQKL